jgi:pimeloyl-ACP methyl ester carboxylesterase
LNVAVDELGGRAALVGLCQGGWLASIYAARFPQKVAALVVAGAPIDLAAAPSQIVENVAATPAFWLHGYLSAFGGLAPGEHRRMQWTRESLDTTELANACWYGRWRKFDLKKAITSEQTSSWLGVVKGDANSLSSVWAIFTSFFSALTYLMTTLTHFWDPEVAFTLQLITPFRWWTQHRPVCSATKRSTVALSTKAPAPLPLPPPPLPLVPCASSNFFSSSLSFL